VTDVLVAGATGRQGGSVVDHLLAGDAGEVTVHGLTRDAGREAIRGGRLAFPLSEGAKSAIVDPDDVGRLAARAFARLTDDRPAPGSGVDGPDPGRLVGARVELAGDVLTLEGMVDVFTDVLGRPVEPVHLPPDAVPQGMRAFLGWMAGLDVDRVPERLRERYGVEPRTLRDYLLRTGWGEDDGDREGTEPTPGSRRDGSGDVGR